MRYISLSLAILLTLFAVVQWNDPDGLLWIGIYMYAATISAMTFYGKYQPLLSIIGAFGYLSGGIYLYQGDVLMWFKAEQEFAGMKTPFIEKSRETFGLLICFAVMIYHLYSRKTSFR